jgi:hypothetical protein
LEFGGSQQEHSAPSILPAQQFGVVLTGVLPSKVTADSLDASCLRQQGFSDGTGESRNSQNHSLVMRFQPLLMQPDRTALT